MIEDRILTRKLCVCGPDGKWVTTTEKVAVQIRWPCNVGDAGSWALESRQCGKPTGSYTCNGSPNGCEGGRFGGCEHCGQKPCELCGKEFTGQGSICSVECVLEEEEHQRRSAQFRALPHRWEENVSPYGVIDPRD